MEKKECWFVYIIEAESGKLYTGITKDLEKRFEAHLKMRTGARFFRTSPPKEILYNECFENRSEATKREIEIKKMSREEKLKIVKKSGSSDLS